MGNFIIRVGACAVLAFVLGACEKREDGASFTGGFDGKFGVNDRSCSSGQAVQDAIGAFKATQTFVFSGNKYTITTSFELNGGFCEIVEDGFYTALNGKVSSQAKKRTATAPCTEDGQPKEEDSDEKSEMSFRELNGGKTISLESASEGNGCPQGDSIVTILEQE